eukprot:gnl/MRDRNA2_/MRDRNA2_138643_c0_seq1.p1 gnl/MRDRNA2_/MRDRNA2_138643_c0~~gnl/MRDRNA2_/MRDRNA2_138643_c0_seq1.p1  ORF type:complete len:655 (+),score=116.75 gnl/MRDRNA2_/MRDRNA2_138643_c0_seq1:225-1967(+)
MSAVFGTWYLEHDVQFAASFLMQILVLGMKIFGGYAYMDKKNYGVGVMTLSSFLTLVSIFQTVAAALRKISKAVMDFKNVVQPVQDVAKFLNLPTDHLYQMDCISRNLVMLGLVQVSPDPENYFQRGLDIYMSGLVEAVRLSAPEFQDMVWAKHKRLKIIVRDVSFCYIPEVMIFDRLNGEIPLGGFGVISGDDSSGRGTLLKMVSGIVKPDAGSMLIPPFLRVVHIPRDPFIIEGNLLDNLLLFAPPWVNKNHARSVITALGLPVVQSENLKAAHDAMQGKRPSSARGDGTGRESDNSSPLNHEKRAWLSFPQQMMQRRSLKKQQTFSELKDSEQPKISRAQQEKDLSMDGTKSMAWTNAIQMARRRGVDLETTLMSSTERSQRENTSARSLRTQDLLIVEVGRAILADPEVLVANCLLDDLVPFQREIVLKVLVKWQKGGLKALLENPGRSSKKVSDEEDEENNPYPGWLSPNGDVKRTLLMTAHYDTQKEYLLPAADFVVRLREEGSALEVEQLGAFQEMIQSNIGSRRPSFCHAAKKQIKSIMDAGQRSPIEVDTPPGSPRPILPGSMNGHNHVEV